MSDHVARDPLAWVRDGAWVEIRSQAGVEAAGEVIGYQPNPTVVVITEQGRKESWPVSAAYPAQRPDRALTLRLEPDDGRRWRGENVAGPWELMNRRGDGGDDGPNFASLDYLHKLGTVVIT